MLSLFHFGKSDRKSFFPMFGCGVNVLTAIVLLSCEIAEARTVRVGVYDNPPKVEMGDGVTPHGIFIDLIEYMAEREKWDIQYVFGTWEQGLDRLERGQIDLMPDVAVSESRCEHFDFNQLPVLCSWLQVVCRKDVAIKSVADFEGKTLALLEGSIQQQVCEDLRRKFGLSFNQVALPDYDTMIEQVESGKADAAIVSRFYGYRREKEVCLLYTPVILHPTALHFATTKGLNKDLIHAIDMHLAEMMKDLRSLYYRSLNSWIHEKPRTFIPQFVKWIIISIFSTLLAFLILSLALKWQVTKRTEELRQKNEDLMAALRELQAARDQAIQRERLHALGQLACGVAHDFNNLLVPIMGCTELLLSDPRKLEDKEKLRLNLEVVHGAAKHGTEMVRHMQQFYRSVRSSDVKERVDVNEVIHEVVELTNPRLNRILVGGTRIKVVLTLGHNAEILGRRSDIYEMLLNLVLNAADAMPQGGCLEISTETVEGAVRVTVKDNGAGMSAEVRQNCLRPFFTTKGEKGTGMGLAMVSNIIEEHEGHIEIVSAPDEGTSFILTFRCLPVQSA